MRHYLKTLLTAPLVLLLVVIEQGCATVAPKDYTQYRQANTHSILVVPAINRSVNVDAPNCFLATISVPLAERGYYVFPVNMVKSVMENEGLADANLVHTADPVRLGELFGADAILYVTIESWEARYMLLTTEVIVELSYQLKSAISGQLLWQNSEKMTYSPDNSNGGIIGAIIGAAITKAAPEYRPLAKLTNALALNQPHKGIPAGPYHQAYQQDMPQF